MLEKKLTTSGNARSSQRVAAPAVARDRILHAAAHLFRKQGYKGTTVRDIADAVGILSGSLFHHFRSKEEMLLVIMQEVALSLCISAEGVLKRTSSPVERLQQLIDLELEWMVTDVKKDYLAVLVFEWREVSDAAKPQFTRLRKRYTGLWLNVLEDCNELTPLRIVPDAAAHVLHGALISAINWFKPLGRYRPDEFRNMLMMLIQH